jgi:hypothetical protein
MSNKPTVSKLPDKYQTYPTAQAAAVAALRGIGDQKHEFGGGVLYNKEQNVYAPTEAVGQGDGGHFEAAVGIPKGWQLHSTYHTHPAAEDRSTQFSPNDIDTATQLKAPSYVLAREDNKIRVFDPSTSKVQKDPGPGSLVGGLKYSNGSLVDETPPAPDADASTAPSAGVAPSPATTTPVTGSRITMKDFAARHRAMTTKYKHRVIHIKTK